MQRNRTWHGEIIAPKDNNPPKSVFAREEFQSKNYIQKNKLYVNLHVKFYARYM